MQDLDKFKNEMNLSGKNVYVGHRYVPKIMGDWDDTQIYEPLSIVQYQGNSFTSRQYVPSGVEITNEEYWASTGNYNAQVEQYRQDVRNLENNVNNVNDEVIAARNGEDNLKSRIDKDYQEVNEKLAQNTNYLTYTGVNIAQFNRETGETNDNGRLARAITQAMTDDTHVVINENIIIGDFENSDSGLTLVGTGSLTKDENATGILTLSGDYVVIEGLSFNSFNPVYTDGFLLRINGEHPTITHNKFNDQPNAKEFIGLEMSSGSSTGIITSNHFNNSSYMFFMSDGSKNMTVTGNTFKGGYRKGDYTNGNAISGLGDGVKLSRGIGGEYVVITNNVFIGLYRDAIDAFTSGVHVDFSHNICRDIDVLVADIKTIYRGAAALDSTNPDKPTSDIVIAYNLCDVTGQGLSSTSVFYVGHTNNTEFPEYDTDDKIVQNVRIEYNKVISRKNEYIIRTGMLDGLIVKGNEFEAYDTVSYIWVRNNATNIQILDNFFKALSSTGKLLNLTDVSNVVIDRNEFYCFNYVTLAAIQVQTSKNVTINNNKLRDNNTVLMVDSSEGVFYTNNYMENTGIAIRYGSTFINKLGTIKNNTLVKGSRFILFSNVNDRILCTDNISFNVDNALELAYGNTDSLTNSIVRNNELINQV